MSPVCSDEVDTHTAYFSGQQEYKDLRVVIEIVYQPGSSRHSCGAVHAVVAAWPRLMSHVEEQHIAYGRFISVVVSDYLHPVK